MTDKPTVTRRLTVHFTHSFDFGFGRAAILRPSVLAILLANIFPLIGVVALGWDTFFVLVLFWMENVVVGIYTFLKLLSVASASVPARVSAALFFCVHYGLFTAVHGLFVFLVFGTIMDGSPEGTSVWQTVLSREMVWGAIVLLVSHGVSFAYNYIRGGEFRKTNLNAVMQEPYGRVVLLHVTIIFGGFLVMLMGSPVAGLLLLVALKTGMDIRAHLRQHEKYGETPETTGGAETA